MNRFMKLPSGKVTNDDNQAYADFFQSELDHEDLTYLDVSILTNRTKEIKHNKNIKSAGVNGKEKLRSIKGE